ncbi:hypothetical protein K458DRAFT_386481 [Lentithecium fluviatile CBS 122367]|uniref:Uncharacterized protein n=1 Tax=Lentithecium fluviatile CBS 122367 TaxID=1168545 RepID=A0A6G1J8J0_9PLEO|nr:hypothetical protein K458DRAFT_386481 [Lentithecium fluviatile CBS 122367]
MSPQYWSYELLRGSRLNQGTKFKVVKDGDRVNVYAPGWTPEIYGGDKVKFINPGPEIPEGATYTVDSVDVRTRTFTLVNDQDGESVLESITEGELEAIPDDED